MPVEEKKKICMQNVFLENRNRLNVTGVLDVLNFDEQTITVETELGVLAVKGSDLKLNKYNLDDTELSIEGEICSLAYEDKINKKNESLLAKIFK
ncbi:MAG: sporulation protein YabP [Clostridia bacterium]|nr:sporulation protein YabP [Clostridia bacterium]